MGRGKGEREGGKRRDKKKRDGGRTQGIAGQWEEEWMVRGRRGGRRELMDGEWEESEGVTNKNFIQ